MEEAVGHGMGLSDAFEVAHSRVRADQETRPDFRDMGTTLVAVLERDHDFELAWVGDSRAYRYSGARQVLECLTRDHNIAGRLLAAGNITAEQARAHPQRNVLTDCIGQRDRLPTIELERHQWRQGDRLLLCSDGLSGELTDTEIADWLGGERDRRRVADGLLRGAMNAGGRDNISLILLDPP
ncbi:MAG: PP2C family protein-serine/threonine phosphatase [Wenzhouxiangellaceae bacterium]